MSVSRNSLVALLAAFAVSSAGAQGSDAERGARERATAVDAQRAERREVRAEQIDVELREAEERMAEAAARIAELSSRRLPAVADMQRHFRVGNRPVLGVTIGAEGGSEPVEGVTVRGVTPGGAAADAGLRSGDVLTAVNDESLSASNDEEANRKLLDFLEGIKEGDVLDVEYLRDGDSASVELSPRPVSGGVFAFAPNGGAWAQALPALPAAPGAPGPHPRMFSFFLGGGSWGDMEMVALTDELGRYFGTDKGLLVVRAPADANLKLRDGDVIQSIDGREPTSVSHAMRILGSYQGGETLELKIMRDRKRETLSVAVPDNRSSFIPRIQSVAPPVEAGEVVVTDRDGDVIRERT